MGIGLTRKRLETSHDYVCVADESGITKDQHLFVGCLVMRRSNLRHILDRIERYRADHKMHRELKWTKITDQREAEYSSLIEAAYSFIDNRHAQFHMIAFDTHTAKHSQYNYGDADVGLNKLYYQLILHRVVRRFGPHGTIHVRLDKRINSTPLHDLQVMLNNTAARDFKIQSQPVKVVEATESKRCDLLQVNDVLLGGFTALKNKRPDSVRKSKINLSQKIFNRSGLSSLDADSSRTGQVTYWQFKGR